MYSNYFIYRPLGSSWSGSSIGRRKKRHDYHLHHAGVVVTIDQYVVGRDKWLIHKGSDYGDAHDTVITDASYMGSRLEILNKNIVIVNYISITILSI